MDWAIETARSTGIALASSHNANHYGIAHRLHSAKRPETIHLEGTVTP